MSSYRRSKASGGFSDVNGRIADSLSSDADRQPIAWRVFVNHIDSYHASKVVELLRDQVYEHPMPRITPKDRKKAGKISNSKREIKDNDENEEREASEEEEEEKEKKEDDDDGKEEAQRRTIGKETKRNSRSDVGEQPRKFELIGTAVDTAKYHPCADIQIIPPADEDREKFMAVLLTCGYIIYDATQDESQIEESDWVLKELARNLDNEDGACRGNLSESPARSFILISSVMTWAHTGKRQQPFTEADYRKRKAPERYRQLIQCERNCATALRGKSSLYRKKLRTVVLCAGVTYGEGEQDLEYLFKLAWLNEKRMPVIKIGPNDNGNNLVPLLHVRDLASAVFELMKQWPNSRYVVAVENGRISQSDLVKAISKSLSTGRTELMTIEETLARHRNVTQRVLDAITLDLDIRPVHLLGLRWRRPGMTFRECVDEVAREFLQTRRLRPVRLVILGPPASGKSLVARELARRYRLQHLRLDGMITETINLLVEQIEELKEKNEISDDENLMVEDENEMAEDENVESIADGEILEGLERMLSEINNGLEENNGRLNDGVLTKVLQWRMQLPECQNQGYVLDGYPKTLEQARMLFDPGFYSSGEEAHTEDDELENKQRSSITPDHVIVLEASDDFLVERVINRSEKELLNTRYTEEDIHRRLRVYREKNDDSNTPLQVFDELEIHPIILNIEMDKSPEMASIFQYCFDLIGPPHNYGASTMKLEEDKRRAEAEAALAETLSKREAAERRRIREKRAVEWMELLNDLKCEEEELLRLKAEPLRHYLTENVFPPLTEALIEVAKLRPTEPIDFVAEHLFKKNSEGRTNEPDHTDTMSSIISSVHGMKTDGILDIPDLNEQTYELARSTSKLSDDIAECDCDSDRSNDVALVHVKAEDFADNDRLSSGG